MKNLEKVLIVLLTVTLPVLLPCCKKGDTGAPGEKGIDGNANVQVYTYSLQNAVWTTVGSVGNGFLMLDVAAPKVLTADVVENNVVLVYVKSSDFSSWALLPYYTERNIRVTADVSVGRIRLRRDQNGSPSTQSFFLSMRVVVMEKTADNSLSISPERIQQLPVVALK